MVDQLEPNFDWKTFLLEPLFFTWTPSPLSHFEIVWIRAWLLFKNHEVHSCFFNNKFRKVQRHHENQTATPCTILFVWTFSPEIFFSSSTLVSCYTYKDFFRRLFFPQIFIFQVQHLYHIAHVNIYARDYSLHKKSIAEDFF